MNRFILISTFFVALFISVNSAHSQERQRVRDLGIHPGILTPGTWNAITDVEGVMVGHQTLIEGDHIRTGVTAILPHNGNLFQDRVPAAIFVGNGFGKALGFTQVQELGELETPLALTNTLGIFNVAHGVADFVLNLSGNEQVRSVNPVVGETNDGWLNDIRARVVGTDDVYKAIESATSGPVAEGNVGAGTGTRALGFKAGIGTSSRKLPENRGGYTVGVLVQSNFGGVLTINGAPVGEELGNHYMSSLQPTEKILPFGSTEVNPSGNSPTQPVKTPSEKHDKPKTSQFSDNIKLSNDIAQTITDNQENQSENNRFDKNHAPNHTVLEIASKSNDRLNLTPDDGYDYDVDGSIMIIVATDAPITSRNLERLAKRAFMGIARVGGFASNGSGDYVIAFSTHPDVRRNLEVTESTRTVTELDNDAMSPLFLAAVEATEEAILNSLFMSESMTGAEGRTQPALPIDEVLKILKKYGAIR